MQGVGDTISQFPEGSRSATKARCHLSPGRSDNARGVTVGTLPNNIIFAAGSTGTARSAAIPRDECGGTGRISRVDTHQ